MESGQQGREQTRACRQTHCAKAAQQKETMRARQAKNADPHFLRCTQVLRQSMVQARTEMQARSPNTNTSSNRRHMQRSIRLLPCTSLLACALSQKTAGSILFQPSSWLPRWHMCALNSSLSGYSQVIALWPLPSSELNLQAGSACSLPMHREEGANF